MYVTSFPFVKKNKRDIMRRRDKKMLVELEEIQNLSLSWEEIKNILCRDLFVAILKWSEWAA